MIASLAGGALGTVSKTVAFNTVVQALYASNATTGVWYDGVDPAYRSVNSDGTGGIPATNSAFGRLIDRTGGGRHAVQTAVANQPIAKTDAVSFACQSYPYGVGNVVRSMQASSASSGTMRSTSGVIICDIHELPIENVPVSGMSQNRSANAFPCVRSFLAWRCGPSGYELYVDKKLYTGSPLAATAVLASFIGVAAGQSDSSMKFFAYVTFDTYLSNTDFATLRTAAENFSGANRFTNDVVIGFGDSNMKGVFLSDSAPWLTRLTAFPTARIYNTGTNGASLNDTVSPYPNNISKYLDSGTHYAVVCSGINSITSPTASDFADLLRSFLLAKTTQNFRIVVCTYPNDNPAAVTYNAKIRADAPTDYADAFADLVVVPQLSDRTNATYFQLDQLHLNETAQPFIAAAVDAAVNVMFPLPYPKFNATPYNGTTVNSVFTNNSTGATSYAWDFNNDGTVDSTVAAPTNNFAVNGEFTPRLIATNAAGSATRIRRFYINKRAALAASPTLLVGQYVLNAGITQAGGFVSAWADQSGAGNNLIQTTGVNQPAVDGTGIITFDGISQFMQTASFGLGTPLTLMLRVKINAFTSGKVLLDGLVTGTRRLQISGSRLAHNFAGSDNTITETLSGTYLTIFCGSFSDYTSLAMTGTKLSGSESVLGYSTAGSSAGGITLGAAFNGTNPASISVKGALIYSGGISRAAIAQNEAYLDSL